MATYDLTQGIPSVIKKGDTLNCPYSGTYKIITLPRGAYGFHCWGAQGGGSDTSGNTNSGIGGKGGYAAGDYFFDTPVTLYLYVGGQGESSITGLAKGGWNGGGSSFATSNTEPANGGGGASDIRIASTSLYARVIVAGGGGGGGEDTSDAGGGAELAGTNGGNYPGTIAGSSGGAAFGYGANTSYDGGAGGGGWYGGGTNGGSQSIPTVNNTSDAGGGSGGSNYVYTSSTASNYPSGCLLNSDYYATWSSTKKGNENFTSPNGSSETGHSGNGYIRISVYRLGKSYNISNGSIPEAGKLQTGDELYCHYSGTYKKITLPPGQYELNCWGATGGYRTSSDYAGDGGYSKGTLTLLEDTDLYLYAGGSGNTGGSSGGWNGGGRRSSYPGGGGASDIRIASTSLYARVIVAGGGGSDGAVNKKGGNGGGASGQSVEDYYGTGGYGGGSTGVTNSSWQTTSQSTSTTTQSGAYAGFGFGGNGISYASGHGGAGGGGWYGGSGSYPDGSGDDDRGGGGGSSYAYTSSTASQYPSGCLLNSNYYLTNITLQQGGNGAGNGYVFIIVLKANENGVYVKMNGNWTKATGVLSKVNNVWQETL